MPTPGYSHKVWKDQPDHTTPISAAALEDLEDRVTQFALDTASTLSNTFKGVWSSGTTYQLGNGVSVGLNNYVSTINANTNHNPVGDDGSHWTPTIPSSVLSVSSPKLATIVLTPSGSDDAAAMQTAATAGGTVALGPGTFLWNSAVPNLGLGGQTIRGAGVKRTTIQLSALAPRAFDCDSGGNTDQLVSDITIQDMTIDANSIAGADHHCLFGNKATQGLRTSFARIRLVRCRVINLTCENPASHNRQGIWIGSVHSGTAQTLSTITDIFVDDVVIEGGNSGLVIVGTFAQGNVFIDRVTVPYFYHSTGSTSFTGSSAGVQIGQNAYCGTVKLGRIHSVKSQDVGVEIDNCQDLHIETVTGTDVRSAVVLLANFYWTLGSAQLPSQSSKVGHINYLTTNSNVGGQAFAIHATGGSPLGEPYGEAFVGSIHVQSSRTTGAQPGALSFKDTQATLIDIGTIDYEAPLLNDTTTGAQLQEILVQPNGASHVHIGRWRSHLAGTYSAGQLNPCLVQNSGAVAATLMFEVDAFVINHAVTASAEDSFFQLLGGTVLTLGGHIKGGKVRAAGSQSQGGIRVDSSANLTIKGRFLIDDCDFSGMSGGTEIVWVGTTTAGVSTTKNSVKSRVSNITYQSGNIGSAPVTEAANASPWSGTSPSTYINDTGTDLTVNVRGGTVSVVAVSINGTSANVGSASPCSGAWVPSGALCTITFTVAPNIVRVLAH